jgi:dynein heavy chain
MSGGSVPESSRDPRLVYLGRYVQRTLKLKPEKWNRLFAVEEHRTAVMDFLDKPEPLVRSALCFVRFLHALQI